MESTKASKSKAGYIHIEGTQYECVDCPMWLESSNCIYAARKDEVLKEDTCSYFSKGPRGVFGFMPLSLLTPEQLGWVRNPSKKGYSCKRCEYWNLQEWKCSEVDEDSPGDDPGMIHPDACCNFWGPDAERSTWSVSDFYEGGPNG